MKLRNGKEYFFRPYRVLYWQCGLSPRDKNYNININMQPCTPARSHAICKSDFIKRHFKYRINRVLYGRLPEQEMMLTEVHLPMWMRLYRERMTQQADYSWPLDTILSGQFSVYFN